MKRAVFLLALTLAAAPPKESPRPKLSPEALELLGLAYASPPEIAADALLRLAAWDKAAGREAKLGLIEEAFNLAGRARDRYPRRAVTGVPADSRAGAVNRAARLELDSLSLRARAVRAALDLDQTKARELFERIEAPRPEARACRDALIYDLTAYYRLVSEIAARTFSAADLRLEQHISFVRAYLMGIASPVEIAPGARLVRSLAVTWPQRGLLAATLASALAGVALDARSWLEVGPATTAEVSSLVEELTAQGIAADGLREASDKYVARQGEAAPCASAAENPPYWTSPGAQALLERAMKLRWGPSGRPERMLSLDERRSIEWQSQLADALKEMHAWKPGLEESEADHFHQRCLYYESLVDLTPPGAIRDNLSASFASFLSGAAIQRESPAEWLSHALDIITRLRQSGDGDAGRLAETFVRSGNPALGLAARLEQLSPRSPLLVPR